MALPFKNIDDIRYPLELSLEELKQEDTIQDVEYLTTECLKVGESGPPDDLFRGLTDILARYAQLQVENSILYKRYQQARVLCLFSSLMVRPENEVQELCTRHILEVVHSEPVRALDIDIRDRFYIYIWNATILGGDQRSIRAKLMQYLNNNTESFGGDILVRGGTTNKNITNLGAWVRDYASFFPRLTVRGGLQRIRYLSTSENVRQIDSESQKDLLKVLELYDFLDFPALAWKELGRELPTKIITIEEARAQVKVQPLPDLLTTAQRGEWFALLDAQLQSAVERVNQLTHGNIQSVLRAFYDNLFPVPGVAYDQMLALGSLIMLTKSGWILRMLSEPNPVRQRFEEYLKHEGAPQDLEAFRLAPASPLSLGKFLKFVLVRRMRMGEQDAAKIAIKIGNLLKQGGKDGYVGMAYFDQTSDQFHWKI